MPSAFDPAVLARGARVIRSFGAVIATAAPGLPRDPVRRARLYRLALRCIHDGVARDLARAEPAPVRGLRAISAC